MNANVRFEAEADEDYRAAAGGTRSAASGSASNSSTPSTPRSGQIVRLPEAGAPVRQLPSDLPVRRAPVKRFPYHVIYLELNGEIRVLAVAHDRRKPGYWRDRI